MRLAVRTVERTLHRAKKQRGYQLFFRPPCRVRKHALNLLRAAGDKPRYVQIAAGRKLLEQRHQLGKRVSGRGFVDTVQARKPRIVHEGSDRLVREDHRFFDERRRVGLPAKFDGQGRPVLRKAHFRFGRLEVYAPARGPCRGTLARYRGKSDDARRNAVGQIAVCRRQLFALSVGVDGLLRFTVRQARAGLDNRRVKISIEQARAVVQP